MSRRIERRWEDVGSGPGRMVNVFVYDEPDSADPMAGAVDDDAEREPGHAPTP